MNACRILLEIYFLILTLAFSLGIYYAESDKDKLSCLFNMGFCIFILEVIDHDKKNDKKNDKD